MSSNAKGDRLERELVTALDARGFAVMRAPASGSATERELPDVLAGDGGSFFAFEAKGSAGAPIYLTEEEVDALEYFATNFGAGARLAIRFDVEYGDPPYGVDDDPGWRFLHPLECHRTPKNNYRVKKELAYDLGIPIQEL